MKNFNEFINENMVFNSTIYRIPTNEELSKFEKYPYMTPHEIYEEIVYSIIGRGIFSRINKENILKSIQKLCDMYPDSNRYKDVLIISQNNI